MVAMCRKGNGVSGASGVVWAAVRGFPFTYYLLGFAQTKCRFGVSERVKVEVQENTG